MKKKFIITLSALILFTTANIVHSEGDFVNDLATAIKFYKEGNYSQCYVVLNEVLKTDSYNALAHYYMGMTSAQLGKKAEAIQNYESAINLTPKDNNLSRYAKKGKRCIESPEKCESSIFGTLEEEFILNKNGAKLSDEVKGDYERLKIENFMREMNRNEAIDPEKFKDYKDFSNVPTNDEVVAALKVLEKAGFSSLFEKKYSDLAIFTGNSSQNSLLNMINSSSMNPQLIQALLTNNITQGF